MTTTQAANTQEDLISIQLNLEEGMTQRGAERYLRNVSKSVQSPLPVS